METQFSRTQMLVGKPAMDTLQHSRVAVFGLGGVGGHATEVLARSGVGAIDLIDNDCVSITNVNRQLFATLSTIGQLKVDVAEKRIHDINPQCTIRKYPVFYLPTNADTIDFSSYDYVVDCIDTISAKLEIIRRCHNLQIPVISSMGAANKLDATAFRVADINKTKMDPLAKVIRKKLREWHIPHLKVVYSEEQPLKPLTDNILINSADNFSINTPINTHNGKFGDTHISKPSDTEITMPVAAPSRAVPASNAFVPATAGLIIGGEVVKDLIRRAGTMRLSVEDTYAKTVEDTNAKTIEDTNYTK